MANRAEQYARKKDAVLNLLRRGSKTSDEIHDELYRLNFVDEAYETRRVIRSLCTEQRICCAGVLARRGSPKRYIIADEPPPIKAQAKTKDDMPSAILEAAVKAFRALASGPGKQKRYQLMGLAEEAANLSRLSKTLEVEL